MNSERKGILTSVLEWTVEGLENEKSERGLRRLSMTTDKIRCLILLI